MRRLLYFIMPCFLIACASYKNEAVLRDISTSKDIPIMVEAVDANESSDSNIDVDPLPEPDRIAPYSGAFGGFFNIEPSDRLLVYKRKLKRNTHPGYDTVKVFYVTDREKTTSTDAKEIFSAVPSEDMSYGEAIVTIPTESKRKIGEMPSPSIIRAEFKEDPKKHIILVKVNPETKDSFLIKLSDSIKKSAGKNAFVFVHGYNSTFEDAARRTAQMTYDLRFDGAPIFYSWPSKGRFFPYTHDVDNIDRSEGNIKRFLYDFFANSNAENVYLIAHSMGNVGLTKALAVFLNEKPAYAGRIKEIILAAPDINAATFKKEIAPVLAKAGRPVTIYASSQDIALAASKWVNGFSRLGDSRPAVLTFPGIESVDATLADTSLFSLGHSPHGTVGVLEDMCLIIHKQLRANMRNLRALGDPVSQYWAFDRKDIGQKIECFSK